MTDRAALRPLLLEHLPLLVAAVLYVSAGFAIEHALNRPGTLQLAFTHGAINTIAALSLVFYFGGHALWSLPRVPKDQSAFTWIWREWREKFFTLRRVGGFIIIHLTLPWFSSTFGSLKLVIPDIQPFSWDERFYHLDRAVHLGHDPWRLLQPIFGHPWATVGFNVAYNLWMIILLSMIVWQSCSARRRVRFRFFMTFVLMWIFPGTLLAALFSSAGPCYYHHFVPGPSPYAEQMVYLQGVHDSLVLWALDTQATLWEAYSTGVVTTVSGIAAMPSMHVGAATLFALTGWATDRRLGIPLTIFAVIIQLGSVHLGWHYAIDGYVGAASVLTLWWLVGRVMDRFGFDPDNL